MQGQAACRAGDPPGQGEDPSSEGLGGHDPFTQADAGCPAGQVVGHRLDGQPGAVGGESPRGEMVQPDAVLEVPYRILDLGVAAMISLQFEGLPVPVGDEAVIAVGGKEGELGTGRGLHPSDDEPYRRGVRLGLEGGVGGLGHIGGTVHPVRNRRPGIFGYRLDEIVQAFVLADGDGEADIHPAAGGDESVGVEADSVGPHGELPAAPGVANPAHRFTQEVGGAPGGLSQLNLNAAGIDVGATSHFVAVPADRAEQPVQEFEAFTADLYRLADWLAECGVETVVMESTGVYWIPLFGVLEERDFQVMLVDPRRIKNVPGRKTDVLDCQWLQQLHTYGLLSGAFRPDEEIRRLRSYLRQRVMLVQYASHHIQHMQKALTQMNVKLHHVISDITGKTGMDIIEAIVGGQRDPRRLAQLRDPRIKADEGPSPRLYRFYQDKIAECDREIEAQLERFEDHSNGDPPAAKSGRRRGRPCTG